MKKPMFLTLMFFMICSFVFPADTTDIIEAAKRGDAGTIKKLLKKNPDLTKATDNGIGGTALHWACIYGRKKMIKFILGYNPDVNFREKHGGTSMHWAAHFDDSEVITWLLEHGAKIDAANRFGRTPLQVAARRGCLKVIKILIKRGADMKVKLGDGSTVLHTAARNGHREVIEYLIERGMDPEIKNKQDQTYQDVFFKRPKTIKIDLKMVNLYSGLYQRTDGRKMDIRVEGNRLYYYAFGKDELLPISKDQFIMSAEKGIFTFTKNQKGEINELIYKIDKLKIRARKIK